MRDHFMTAEAWSNNAGTTIIEETTIPLQNPYSTNEAAEDPDMLINRIGIFITGFYQEYQLVIEGILFLVMGFRMLQIKL